MRGHEQEKLEQLAHGVRINTLCAIHAGLFSYTGASLSVADLMAYLHGREMQLCPEAPDEANNDRFVLSKSRSIPALYAVLAAKNHFPGQALHCHYHTDPLPKDQPGAIPGLEMTMQFLGTGLASAREQAYQGRLLGRPYRVYALLDEKDCATGLVGEDAAFAAREQLDNLCVIVECNRPFSGPGGTAYPVRAIRHFQALGWNTAVIDAHDFEAMEHAFSAARHCKNRPSCIFALSRDGKGVSFLEDHPAQYNHALSKDQRWQAIQELIGTMFRQSQGNVLRREACFPEMENRAANYERSVCTCT